MLNYQTLSINNFSGGLSDEYRNEGTKFNKLTNFKILPNGSLKLREGVGLVATLPQVEVRAIEMLSGEDIVVFAGDRTYVKSSEGFEPPTTDLYLSTSTTGLASIARWRNSVLIQPKGEFLGRIVKTSTNTYISERGGLPLVKATVTAGTGKTRLWALCLERTYTDADGFTYTEYSPEAFGSVLKAETGTISVDFTALSYNMDGTNILATYATKYSSLKLSLFLTQPNGTVLYKAGSITAPTTPTASFTGIDTATLESKEVGTFFSEVAKVPVPVCNYFALSNNTAYYAGVKDLSTNAIKPYRLYQSVQGMPTSVIADAYLDFDSPILGVADLNGTPIVLTKEYCYRVEGTIGIDDSGNMRAVKIQSSEGGVSHGSMVVANQTLFYAGTDGIYATDGFTAQNISGPNLFKSYSRIIADPARWSAITATYERSTDSIIFNMGSGIFWVLHTSSYGFTTYDLTQSKFTPTALHSAFTLKRSEAARVKDHKTFTQTTVGATTYSRFGVEVSPSRYIVLDEPYRLKITDGTTSAWVTGVAESVDTRTNIAVFVVTENVGTNNATQLNSKIYEKFATYSQTTFIGTNKSMLTCLRDDYFSDFYVTTATYQIDYPRKAIKYNWLTSGVNYGDTSTYKWVKDVTINSKTIAKYAMEPYTVREADNNSETMKLISNIEQFRVFDDSETFGRSTAKLFPSTIISGKRHLPKGFCKSLSNQIGGTSTTTAIYQSKDFSNAEVTRDNTTSPEELKLVLKEVEGLSMPFPYDSEVEAEVLLILNGVKATYPVRALKLSDDRLTLSTVVPNSLDINTGDEVEWILYSYPKEQSFEIFSVDVDFAPLANSGKGYKRKDDLRSNY